MKLLVRPPIDNDALPREASPTRLSGERNSVAAYGTAVIDEANDFWSMADTETEPDYTELVLDAYTRLDELRQAREAGIASDRDVAEFEAEVDKLEELEGEQVKQRLESRLLMPLGEGQRRLNDTDAMIAKYGDPTSSAG